MLFFKFISSLGEILTLNTVPGWFPFLVELPPISRVFLQAHNQLARKYYQWTCRTWSSDRYSTLSCNHIWVNDTSISHQCPVTILHTVIKIIFCTPLYLRFLIGPRTAPKRFYSTKVQCTEYVLRMMISKRSLEGRIYWKWSKTEKNREREEKEKIRRRTRRSWEAKE